MAKKPDVYFVCPVCGEFSRGSGWTALYMTLAHIDDNLDVSTESVDVGTLHKCGYVSTKYTVTDYVVEVLGDTIVRVGRFYKDHPALLRKIADKERLQVSLE